MVNALTINALTDVRARVRSETGPKIDFEIPVISGDRIVVARRKEKILELLEDAITRDVFRQSLISAVATTEDYLLQSLTIVLRWYPRKLTVTGSGVHGDRKVSLEQVLEARDMNELISRLIEGRLVSVFYASPQEYFGYIEHVLGFELPEDAKAQYVETKATRDILIHNSGIVNELYVRKAGPKARASEGKPVPLDDQYLSESIRCMKRVVACVYSGCLENYGDVDVGQAT